MSLTESTYELLPDPDPREVFATLISVDDHVVEPADMFDGRLPRRMQADAPRIARQPDGTEPWVFDGEMIPQSGSNAVVGQRHRDRLKEPMGFDHMRPGCYDVHQRVRDMDINGVWAEADFPSIISGFCGRIFAQASDQQLGFAVTQAWNDWMYEEWHGAYPDRFIPMGITWLADPALGAAEIRRNAERGFVAVSLPERPHKIGLPSLHSGYWDPVIQACVDTGTVVALHVGSSGVNAPADDAPGGVLQSMFPTTSMEAAADWVWSGLPVRYPELRIVMAEGGIGWVPMLIDRLDFTMDHAGGPSYGSWDWARISGNSPLGPSDVLRRNFWFTMLDDPKTLALRHAIGIDHIMAEVDYPHADSTWPDSQAHFRKLLDGVPVDEVRKIMHGNAAALFRHPLPPDVRP